MYKLHVISTQVRGRRRSPPLLFLLSYCLLCSPLLLSSLSPLPCARACVRGTRRSCPLLCSSLLPSPSPSLLSSLNHLSLSLSLSCVWGEKIIFSVLPEPTRTHAGAYVAQRMRAKLIGHRGIVGPVSGIVRGGVLGPMGDSKRLSASSYRQYFSSFSSVWD